MHEEQQRLDDARTKNVPWRKWGPYLSERQWGTVREDYSENGDAWELFHPRPGALARVSLGRGRLRGVLRRQAAPLLRPRAVERPRSDPQGTAVRAHERGGNHGEDVKEYYFYLDSTPTHSYMKWLYKYPQGAYPYADLIDTNRRAIPHGLRVRAAGHRRVRGGPVLRRVRGIREAGSRRRADPDHRGEPRPGRRDAARAADSVVSKHVDVVAGDGRSRSCAKPRRRRACA